MSTARLIRARASFPCWTKIYNHGIQHSSLTYRSQHVRNMGVFQEISKNLKGEMEKNPELKRTIQDLKESTGRLQVKTSQTLGQVIKQSEGIRASTKQIFSVVREKVNEGVGKLSEATSQKHGEPDEKIDCGSAAIDDKNTSKVNTGKAAMISYWINACQTALDKIKGTKVVGVVKNGFDLVKEELTVSPSRKAKAKVRAKYATASAGPRSSCTDLIPVERKRTLWEQRWDFIKGKTESNGIYKRFKGVKKHPIVVKGQEIVEDMRERWETSDNPMVHKIQDLNDSVFGETSTAVALREIRKRDPTFSFPDFLAEVQESANDVLQAYLKGDLNELQKWCSRQVIDRCRAERRAYECQGIFCGNKILHISDIELKDTKLLGNVPVIVVTFRTQQVYCVFDKNGNITQGGKDDILNVYYAWAMQQVSPDEMEVGDIFPQWQLLEMQQLGVKAII